MTPAPHPSPQIRPQMRFRREHHPVSPDRRDEITGQFAEGTYCNLCGGIHPGLSVPACPRVASFELDADGKLRAATFWQDGDWDTSGTYFASDVEEDSGPS